eukprot:362012-Chlamydomonas_euryale.AAC.2
MGWKGGRCEVAGHGRVYAELLAFTSGLGSKQVQEHAWQPLDWNISIGGWARGGTWLAAFGAAFWARGWVFGHGQEHAPVRMLGGCMLCWAAPGGFVLLRPTWLFLMLVLTPLFAAASACGALDNLPWDHSTMHTDVHSGGRCEGRRVTLLHAHSQGTCMPAQAIHRVALCGEYLSCPGRHACCDDVLELHCQPAWTALHTCFVTGNHDETFCGFLLKNIHYFFESHFCLPACPQACNRKRRVHHHRLRSHPLY